MDLKEATFVILKNHASAPIRKKRLSPMSTASREFEFVKKGGMTDRVESFGEVDCSENRPRVCLGLLNPSENE